MLHLPTVISISLLLNILIGGFFITVYKYKKQRCYLYLGASCAVFVAAQIFACLRIVLDNTFITHYLADLCIIISPVLAIIGLQKITYAHKSTNRHFLTLIFVSSIVLLPIYAVTAGQMVTSIIIATLFMYAAYLVHKMKCAAPIQQKILSACFISHSIIMYIQSMMLAAPHITNTVLDFHQPLQAILINHIILATTTALVLPFLLFVNIEEKLQRLVNHDTLTCLLNRRGFFMQGQAQIKQGIAHQQSFAVVMIDIDHFKRVNDKYGHSTGDTAIKWIAQHIMAQLNDHDIAARIGGEEFALLLPDQSLYQAKETAQRLCDAIREHSLHFKGNSIDLSVSVGISSSYDANASIKTLLDQADKRLYIAKAKGRDQVVICDHQAGQMVNNTM